MTQSLQSKPSSVTVHVSDAGKIVIGAGLRLPIASPHVADPGKISFGAGLRLPAGRKSA